MLKIVYGIWVLSLISLFSCAKTQLADSETLLVGGSPIAETEFPSVIFYGGDDSTEGDCTGTVVGRRMIITGAHCVATSPCGLADRTCNKPSQPKGAFSSGKNLKVYSQSGVSQRQFKIESLELPPSWRNNMNRWNTASLPFNIVDLKTEKSGVSIPDVAFIFTEEELGIVESKVTHNPLNIGANVVLVGYGCDDVSSGTGSGVKRVLSTKKFEVKEKAVLPLSDEYFFTSSGRRKTDSICPGDSGGPVFADDKLVGIHSGALSPPEKPIIYSMHTRLDRGAPVNAWIIETMKRD